MTKLKQTRGIPAALKEAGALVALAIVVALVLRPYAYADTLHEYDLYATAIGLWHGEVWGQGLAGPMHYYVWLCFGYLQLVNVIAGPEALTDRESIIAAMNAVGFWSTVAIPSLCWLTVRAGYGVTIATAATLMFVLSPIFLDLAGAGHPLLPALAMFFAGAAFMFHARDGLARIAGWCFATICLVLALLLRFEVAFAFPFLVLAQPRTDSFRAFMLNALLRCVPGITALAVYFVTQNAMLGSNAVRDTGAFFDQWYSLANLGKGLVAAALAAGAALCIAAAYVVVTQSLTLRGAMKAFAGWVTPRAALLAPLGVIGAALLLWLPNPLPARHFTLFTFGLAVLVAAALHKQVSARALIGGAFAIVLANQLIAVAIGPLVARLSPSDLAAPVGVLLPAPAEPSLTRRAILKARSEESRMLARQIAEDACAPRLVVITSQAPMLIVEMLRTGQRPQIELHSAYPGAFRYRVYDNSREFVFIQRDAGADTSGVIPAVLADPAYADAAVFVDPMTRHRGDAVHPPPDRVESFACGAHGA